MSAEVEHRPDQRIAIVGVGALGCAVLRSLSSAGGVTITIIDGDRVEQANLGRQCLYSPADVGKAKVVAARERMGVLAPIAHVDARDVFLCSENAEALLGGQQVVLDCTDDLHAKDLIDRTCARSRIALVSGGVHAAQGQVMALHVHSDAPSIQRADLFGGRAGGEQDGCDMRLVPVHVVDAVADRMVALLNDILSARSVVNGELAVYSANSWTTFSMQVPA